MQYMALESLFIGDLIPMLGISIYAVIDNIQCASFFGIYITIRKNKLHIIGGSSVQQ